MGLLRYSKNIKLYKDKDLTVQYHLKTQIKLNHIKNKKEIL